MHHVLGKWAGGASRPRIMGSGCLKYYHDGGCKILREFSLENCVENCVGVPNFLWSCDTNQWMSTCQSKMLFPFAGNWSTEMVERNTECSSKTTRSRDER